MNAQGWHPGDGQKFSLFDDMKMEKAVFAGMEEYDNKNVITPIFDPTAFKKDHPPLKIADYQLSEDKLREYGIQVTVLRQNIN